MFILRSAGSRIGMCALTAGLALWATSASAVTKSFDIPLKAVQLEGGAFGSVTLGMPATGTPSLSIQFILPRDYEDDGPVKIVLYLQTPGPPCTARLVPAQLVRRRLGLPVLNSLSGISVTSPTVDLQGNAVVVGKVFTVEPGEQMPGQRRGDALLVQIRREPGDATDTCEGLVIVHGIDIRYPSP